MNNESSPKCANMPPDWAIKASAKVWDRFVETKPFEPLDVMPMAEIIAACFHEEHSTVLTGHLETTDDTRFFAGLRCKPSCKWEVLTQ
jgi:hypothetical protein